MKDKVKAFVEQNPFWTGIIAGFLICFALIGLLSGIGAEQTNSFKNADQILKEDYLRMTVEIMPSQKTPIGLSGDTNNSERKLPL
jgi:p-aminobenzoyl-glutamate transporter AbgT